MSASPNISRAVPFFMVKDMKASLDFYLGKLGFTVTRQWVPRGRIEWCWLEREGVSLMLQEPRDNSESGQDFPLGKGVSICFMCQDALALYREFVQKGVEIREPFVGNNLWVVSLSDPDGYRLEF